MKRSLTAFVGLACLGWSVCAVAQTAISVDGMVESTSGGFKFPDGTVRTSAVAGSLVQETGQTQCFNSSGVSRSCAGTGEDGELLAGLAWPALRFTDNGDGTVTDNLTGLTWLKDTNCPASDKTWQQALDWVALFNTTSLPCTDYAAMAFTDWRLPNFGELLSLVDFGEASSALPAGHPFVSATSFVWSSTSQAAIPSKAWGIFMGADLGPPGRPGVKANPVGRVWPVHGGQ